MCRAIDVASFILQEEGRLSGFQLQKLVYYSQAWCLAMQDRPMFPDVVKAGQHGPVNYEVFESHRGQSSVVASDITGDPNALSVADKEIVLSVLDAYDGLSGDDLAELTHSEDPWRLVYNGSSGLSAAVISNDSMREYYSSLMSASEGERLRHHVPRVSMGGRSFVSDEDMALLDSIS